ncbi:MAG: DegQ family serine endoprotease [Acidiferrobacterales bacterium]|nr:DegQ family serine endoprotease [Acidiferrobacterales bacterium]
MKLYTKLLLMGSLIIASVTSSLVGYAALPMVVEGQPLPSLAPMLQRVEGSVVNIATEAEVTIRRQANPFLDDPFFRRFFEQESTQPRSQKRQGLGSGVVFDAAEGLILTNAHVIEGADKITVTLKDGREAIAQLVGTDKDSDVAVIQIGLNNLNQIPLGNSDVLQVGDFVVAIGNPFGLRQTVTSGIVSALGRSGLGIENYEDFIQTDASINPGNSGGALVNLRGELVGINTAIVAPSGGNVGIGFSIPINMALQIKDQLVQHGEVQRGRLGVRVQDLTPDLAEAFDIKQTRGAIITKVEAGSMADKAGVTPGDVIVKANNRDISKGADLRNTIGLLRVGDRLSLEVMRGNKKSVITTTIGDIEVDSSVGENLNARLQGATFSELSDDQLSSGLEGGVLVSDVQQDTVAWYHGLRPGDIIVSANRKAVRNLDNFRMAISRQDVLLLNIVRANGALFLLLQ